MLAFYLSLIEDHDHDTIMTRVYERYQERMIAYAESILHNYHDAENAVQDAFISIAKRINTIEDPESVTSEQYVYTVVRNAARRYHKTNHKHQDVDPLDDIQNFVSSPDSVSDEYLNNETYHRVLDCLTKMSPIYRDVLSLHYLHHHSAQQIAKLLGKPLATVRSQLRRGTEMLKKEFEEDI